MLFHYTINQNTLEIENHRNISSTFSKYDWSILLKKTNWGLPRKCEEEKEGAKHQTEEKVKV